MGKITDRLIEQHRDINVDHDWWDGVYQQVMEEQEKAGVTIDRIYFSGFWSQGDGACFDGRITETATFMQNPLLCADKFPWLHRMMEKGGGWSLTFRQRGHYVHSGWVEYDFRFDSFYDVMDTAEPVMASIVEVWDGRLEKEQKEFEDAVKDILREAMDDCYSRLEEEYEYLTSDEQVRESLEANEIYDEEDEDELETV